MSLVTLNYPVGAMRFTLIYDGPLPSTAHVEVTDTYCLRKAFHIQLREVWDKKPMLSAELKHWQTLTAEQQAASLHNTDYLIKPAEFGPFQFAPLITKFHHLTCELDILFLRAEKPGLIFKVNSAGDLDNRLGVLFDALQLPKQLNQLPDHAVPEGSERPFLCLLENDDLITAVRIESERLYEPSDSAIANHVRLTIRATVKAQQYSWKTLDVTAD